MHLPPNTRQAIGLAFFRGYTHQEIADHWNMPLGTVKTLMHSAFAQLRVSPEGQRQLRARTVRTITKCTSSFAVSKRKKRLIDCCCQLLASFGAVSTRYAAQFGHAIS